MKFYLGTLLNPKSDRKCDYFPEGMLVTHETAKGHRIREILPLKKGLKKYKGKMNEGNTHSFRSSIILPGFFDMHFHWVQDEVREMPKDSLLEWLKLYTFPTEAKFGNVDYAKTRAREFFKRLSRAGTLGGACYSSVHEHAVDAAMAEVKGHFVIGNVLMNMNSPAELTHADLESIAITKRLIKRYGRRYVFTPRFAITTSPNVMKAGSKLADQSKCFKQSHLSETTAEIEFVLSLYREIKGFENVSTYTEIYQKTGMLGKRSLMGHGIHLSKAELKLLSQTGTTIVHCPTSNAPHEEKGLASGLFDFKRVEKANVRWVLGSDIGGGPFLSMLDVMRSYVDQNAKAGVKNATYVKALYRATLAGAEVMGLGKKAGNFAPRKEVSFIVLGAPEGATPTNPELLLQKLIEPLAHRRDQYDGLVTRVCYQGEFL